MPQLEADAKPRAVTGTRVKAVSRASGSADALALTRVPGPATVEKRRRKSSTSNTVAEQARRAVSKDAEAGRCRAEGICVLRHGRCAPCSG
jgi:hypothetical protein